MTASEATERVFGGIYHITDTVLLQKLKEIAVIQSFAKGEYIHRSGEKPVAATFLLNGVVRAFFISGKGEELTDCFMSDFGYPTMTPDVNRPIFMMSEAVDQVEVLAVPLVSMFKLMEDNVQVLFYKRMFDLWINDNSNNISISCFERILSAMGVKRTPYMEVCSYIPDCSITTVAISTGGDFYRCLHYCMDDKNRLGTLCNDPLRNALGNCDITTRWSYLQENDCKGCDVQEFCCGGCPYVAETINGTVRSRSNTCLIQKAIVHHVHDYLLQFTKGKPEQASYQAT